MGSGATSSGVTRRVAGQGALLFSGFALSQALSFARNALVGHALSKGDFGIAATITLLLQLVETLSDLGAERIVVQAQDGEDPHVVATTHTMLIARGVLTSLVMLVLAHPVAAFFGAPHAAWAFQAAAVVPLIKGFLHLDTRRAQRRLDNRPHLIVEVVPQAFVLAAAWPVLTMIGGFAAVLTLAIAQAAIAIALSHLLAERRYALAADRSVIKRLVAFGWPILASAVPLVLVYQGDRILVGRMLGLEALAAYTVAFMVTMVPGLIAAKVANALMLPLLSDCRGDEREFAKRYELMAEATVLGAALYLIAVVIAGGAIIAFAFGPNYTGLGVVASCLAVMWAMRMVQAVPGVALMALGETRPLFTAGMIRAASLPFAFAAALADFGLTGIAAAGVAAELASLLYVAWRAGIERPGLDSTLLLAAVPLLPAMLLAIAVSLAIGAHPGWMAIMAATITTSLVSTGVLLAAMPALREILVNLRGRQLLGAAASARTAGGDAP